MLSASHMDTEFKSITKRCEIYIQICPGLWHLEEAKAKRSGKAQNQGFKRTGLPKMSAQAKLPSVWGNRLL